MVIVALILLGLCLGSFVNALVWRLHEQGEPKNKRAGGAKASSAKDLSISKGRSMCVHCGHTLAAKDLLPVISWLALKGKCRYCKKSISWQYPLVELATAGLFVISYAAWPNVLQEWETVAFIAWLACLAGFMALIIYDLRWMILPNKIIFALYGLAGLFVAARALSEESLEPIIGAALGILVGGGVFYLLFQLSKGKWIGGGDVKLGFLLGALLGSPILAAEAIFIASLLGSLVAVPLLVAGKATKGTRLPFGPFLIVAAIIVQLFGIGITDWYVHSFIDV